MLKTIFGLTLANLLSPLIQFAASPILTRLYSPSEFGLFSTVYTFATILSLIPSGQLYHAFASQKGAAELESLTQEILVLHGAYLLVLNLLLLLLFDEHSSYLLAVELSFCISLSQTYLFYLSARGLYKLSAFATIFRTLILISLQIFFGTQLPTYSALLISVAISEGVLALSTILLTNSLFSDHTSQPLSRTLRFWSVRRLSSYPVKYLPSQAIALTINFAPLSLLAYMGSSHTAGLFALCLRLTQAPAASLISAIRQTYWKLIDGKVNASEIRLYSYMGQSVTLVVSAGFLFIPSSFYASLFGHQWSQLNQVFPFVLAWVGSSVFAQLPAEVAKQLGHHSLLLKNEVFGATLKGLALLSVFFLTPTACVILFCSSGWLQNIFNTRRCVHSIN